METPPLLPRVEQTIFDGQPAWVKRPEETRSSRFVILYKILQHIMPKVLHPAGALGGVDAIRQEARWLEIFGTASLPVSKVLALTEGSVVLSGMGKQLRGVLSGWRTRHARFGCGSCRGSFAWSSVSKGHDCGRG